MDRSLPLSLSGRAAYSTAAPLGRKAAP